MKQSDIALAYARQGISVFPCKQDKRPATKNGFLDATTDEATIKRWWRKNPTHLIGSPNTHFTVVDIDDQDICASGKMLTENALFRLFSNVLPVGVVTVVTMNNGRHFYFKKNENATRRINVLPNIDLLGEGGFVVLPDQKKYIGDKVLWESIDSLPEFPLEVFDALATELAPACKLAKELKRAHRTGVAPKTKITSRPDMSTLPEELEKKVAAEATRDAIDYKTGAIRFTQTPDMYKKEAKYDVDYSILEKFKNGVLHVEPGELNTAKINALFYYAPIQAQLAGFLGILVPESTERVLQHSVLPGHPDIRPSMGARWSKEGSHILIRDFSNHFSDVYSQLDYNIVRLYATMRYKALVPRMKAPEFVVWFLRLMVDAGMLSVDHLKKKYSMPKFGDNAIWRLAEGIQLLDAIKQLYEGYDGTTTFADRFSAAWCGMEPSATNRAKKALHEGGYLYVDGTCDCSGGSRTDGFYNTKVMSIIDRAKIKTINKSKESSLKEEHAQMAKDKSHVTLRGVAISEQTYQVLQNFCSDYHIPNVPLKKNIFVETSIVDGLVQKEPPVTDNSFLIQNLTLLSAPSMTGKGEVLMVVGESEELEDLFEQELEEFNKEGYSTLSDEPSISVVISSDYSEVELDIESLELKLKDYLQDTMVMDTFFVRYTTSDVLFSDIYDGREPEGE